MQNTHINKILKLAVPLSISNIAMIGMGVVDTIMAGQASAEDLGGLAIGGNLWLIFEMTMWGIIAAITPRVARYYGAKNNSEITQEMQQGIMLSTLIGIIAMFAVLAMIPFVPRLGAEQEVTFIAQGYLEIIAYSLPISGALWASFALLEGHGMVKFVVWSSITAVVLNIIFDYIFVFGKFGAPALGGVGCAWTTTIIYWLWGFAALMYIAKQKQLSIYAIFAKWPGIKLQRWYSILALGVPISLAILAEEGFFNITALMIAPLGTESLGAHQITIQMLAIISMIGFGLGQSTAINVAQSIGRETYEEMFLFLKAGLKIVIGFGLVVGLLVFSGREHLPLLFTQDPAIALVSTAIMFFAPIYLVIDVTQIWASQSLRGYEDTKIPMIMQVISYWFVGFPLGYSLAMTEFWGESYGIYGFWIGLFSGVSFCGLLLGARLWRQSHKYHSAIATH